MPKINPERYEAYIGPQETLKSLTKGTEGLSKSEWCGKVLSNLKHAALPVLNRIGHAIKSGFAHGAWMSNDQVATDIQGRIDELTVKIKKEKPDGHKRAALKDLAYEIALLSKLCVKLQEHGAENAGEIGEKLTELQREINHQIDRFVDVEFPKGSKSVYKLMKIEEREKLLKLAKKLNLPTYTEMLQIEKMRTSPESASMAMLEGTWDINFLKELKQGLIDSDGLELIRDGKHKFKQGYEQIGYLYLQAANLLPTDSKRRDDTELLFNFIEEFETENPEAKHQFKKTYHADPVRTDQKSKKLNEATPSESKKTPSMSGDYAASHESDDSEFDESESTESLPKDSLARPQTPSTRGGKRVSWADPLNESDKPKPTEGWGHRGSSAAGRGGKSGGGWGRQDAETKEPDEPKSWSHRGGKAGGWGRQDAETKEPDAPKGWGHRGGKAGGWGRQDAETKEPDEPKSWSHRGGRGNKPI